MAIFTLTPGIDIFNGTDDDDTFVTDSASITQGDRLDGGGGTNVFKLTGGGIFDLSRILVISIPNFTADGSDSTLIINGVSGITSIDLGSGVNTLQTFGDMNVSSVILTNVQKLISNTGGVTFTVGSGQLVSGGGSIDSISGTGTGNTLSTSSNTLDVTGLTLTNIQKLQSLSTTGATIIDDGTARTIVGGSGNDVITGGGGADFILGGGGADIFKDTAAHFNGVTIGDFSSDDTIDLTDLAPGSVTYKYAAKTGVLTIFSNKVQVAQLTLNGDFSSTLSITSDGAGGTLLKPTTVVPFNLVSADGSGRALVGTPGNDLFLGLKGPNVTNTVLETGSKWAQNTILLISDSAVMISGPNGTDELFNIQRVRFDDGVVMFNLPPAANVLMGLYKTTLNRLEDEAGLNFYLKGLDAGSASLNDISNAFLQSAEASPLRSMSNTDFVNTVYQNSLGRAADADGFKFYVDALAQGGSRADIMLSFASSPEELTLLGQYTKAGVFSPTPDPMLG